MLKSLSVRIRTRPNGPGSGYRPPVQSFSSIKLPFGLLRCHCFLLVRRGRGRSFFLKTNVTSFVFTILRGNVFILFEVLMA